MNTIEFTAMYPPTSLKRHRHSKCGKHTYDPSSKEKSNLYLKLRSLYLLHHYKDLSKQC